MGDASNRRARLGDVLTQFKRSDLETGYSFVYVWLANQFGHFTIGFAGAILCSWVVSVAAPDALTGDFWSRLTTAVLIGCGWLVFLAAKEILLDVVPALRSLRAATAERAAAAKSEAQSNSKPYQRRDTPWYRVSQQDLREIGSALRVFWKMSPPRDSRSEVDDEDWFKYDIVRDSVADGWFYLAGVLTAIVMFAAPGLAPGKGWPWLAPIFTFLILLVVSWPFASKWLWEKVAFDKAALPFVGRFALNGRPVDERQRRIGIDFACGKLRQVEHLIIIGPPKCGRTTTAVALGVEALLRSGDSTVLYTTWCKLLDHVAEKTPASDAREERVLPIEKAELLIVDDVGAEGAGGRPFITAAAFADELRRNKDLRGKFEDKRIIWVIGDQPTEGGIWAEALGNTCRGQVEIIAPGETIGFSERRWMRRAA